MKLPNSSRFIFCECSDGSPQALSAAVDTSVMAGYLGFDPLNHQFVEINFCHLSRANSTAVKNGLRQRIEAATHVKHPNIATILESGTFEADDGSDENPYFISEFVEGERLTDYLNRVKSLKRQLCTSIALQLAETIAALVDYPRLLSAIELDDFAVSLDQGQFLKVRLTDFGFEREETPKGDMQLALQWVRAVGAIHQRILDGRGVPTTLAEMGRTNDHGNIFNGLLKRIEHQSGAQAARTLKGLKPHVLSASGLSESALNYLDPEFRSINRQSDAPVGPLQTLIMEGEEYKETFAARFTPIIDKSCFSFSPFRPLARLKSQHNDARENDSAKAKAALVTLTILPPERLLDHQGTQMLNRKMSDSYLKAHPSSLRTRFLLCESDFTFVVSERFSGISLPTLMAHRGSLDPRDALELIGQIDRALTHFESSDFGMHDFSPWQIDLYFEDVPPDELKKCLSRAPLANWPAWDVKIRVEKPTESFIESACSPWRYLYDRLDQKTFPALMLWLTESDRFDWALTIGNEDREPFSWNPQINSLMDSAIQFFDPKEPKHRKRMLDLLHEIFEKEIRPEPETIFAQPETPALITIAEPEILLPLPSSD